MSSVWLISIDQQQYFGRALSLARSKMKGRYAIDTLSFRYPETLDDLRDELSYSGAVAVKDFVSLECRSDFVVYR